MLVLFFALWVVPTTVVATCKYQPDANGHVNIPESVTSIGNNAFRECTSLVSINIPDSVTSIGYRAFYGCTSLVHINIPNSVTSIGSSAFALTPCGSISGPVSLFACQRVTYKGWMQLMYKTEVIRDDIGDISQKINQLDEQDNHTSVEIVAVRKVIGGISSQVKNFNEQNNEILEKIVEFEDEILDLRSDVTEHGTTNFGCDPTS
eukprot:m.230085 g.230085  ORF g.230085 m.230085 type:complete len:206 (-) comp15996_c0_seq7:232-849(-)